MKAVISFALILLFAGINANAAECKYKAARDAQLRNPQSVRDLAANLSGSTGSSTHSAKSIVNSSHSSK